MGDIRKGNREYRGYCGYTRDIGDTGEVCGDIGTIWRHRRVYWDRSIYRDIVIGILGKHSGDTGNLVKALGLMRGAWWHYGHKKHGDIGRGYGNNEA